MTGSTISLELLRALSWLHARPRTTFALGVAAEGLATAILVLTDADLIGIPGALAVLISILAALAAGPLAGAAVAAAGWAFFFPFVADRDPATVAALPIWLATPLLVGWVAEEMRSVEDERARLAGERALEEAKTNFISTASHELRTPLAAIYGAAVTLERSGARLRKDVRDQLMSVIGSESTRLVRIVNEILLADSLEQGHVPLALEPLDPVEVTQVAVGAQRLRRKDEVALRVSAPPALQAVCADRQKVLEILENLIDNAIKYSPRGATVEIALEDRGDRVRFSVRDSGIGIPEAEQEYVFDRFYRVDPQMKRGVGGTGLGLYICRELVSQMDGRIWVESTEGQGSVFSFELPAVAAGGRVIGADADPPSPVAR